MCIRDRALTAPWLKYYGNTPHSIDYPDKTMYEMIEDAAKRYPDNIAYEFMGKKTDYRTFLARIQATAKALLAFGIRKGDRVTICLLYTSSEMLSVSAESFCESFAS